MYVKSWLAKDICPLVLFRGKVRVVCVPVTVSEDVWTYCVLIAVLDSVLCPILLVQFIMTTPVSCTVSGLGYISVSGQILISSPVSLSQSWTVFLDSACFPFSDQVFRDLQEVVTTVFLQCTYWPDSKIFACVLHIVWDLVFLARALACL
jgi:hypothetical protein